MNYNDLMKNLGKDYTNLRKHRIGLLGDSATQLLARALKCYGYEIGYNFDIWEADYDQIDGQVFNYDSDLYQFDPEYIIIFYSAQKLLKKFFSSEIRERPTFAEYMKDKINSIYDVINSKLKCKIIFLNFFEINDAIFGNFANKTEYAFLYQIRKLNFELMNLAQINKNMFICDMSALLNTYGASYCVDSRMYVNADITLSIDFLPITAKSIADIILSISGNFKKCLILDLDNTLWGGIIGDDGIENIEIGNLGIGKAFTEFQLWIRELKQRGIILAICSKNSEATAMEPFKSHPEMILKLDDIAIFVANWENKVDNIRHIQQVLNIGFDSMVFLDDNPVERDYVRNNFPAITIPELPEDPSTYLSYLRTLNLFETASYTKEDEQRSQQYREEAQRIVTQSKYSNYDDYLADLGMQSEVKKFDQYTIPRVAQLTQRTNQFNLRTIRYSEEEIQSISSSRDHITISFTLEDKFGDHGLISAIILNKRIDHLWIDTWIMSCRVFKRGMEYFVMNNIVKMAKENGLKYIFGEYIPTAKNSIVDNLYESLGFSKSDKGENLYHLTVENYPELKSFIKLKN